MPAFTPFRLDDTAARGPGAFAAALKPALYVLAVGAALLTAGCEGGHLAGHFEGQLEATSTLGASPGSSGSSPGHNRPLAVDLTLEFELEGRPVAGPGVVKASFTGRRP